MKLKGVYFGNRKIIACWFGNKKVILEDEIFIILQSISVIKLKTIEELKATPTIDIDSREIVKILSDSAQVASRTDDLSSQSSITNISNAMLFLQLSIESSDHVLVYAEAIANAPNAIDVLGKCNVFILDSAVLYPQDPLPKSIDFLLTLCEESAEASEVSDGICESVVFIAAKTNMSFGELFQNNESTVFVIGKHHPDPCIADDATGKETIKLVIFDSTSTASESDDCEASAELSPEADAAMNANSADSAKATSVVFSKVYASPISNTAEPTSSLDLITDKSIACTDIQLPSLRTEDEIIVDSSAILSTNQSPWVVETGNNIHFIRAAYSQDDNNGNIIIR